MSMESNLPSNQRKCKVCSNYASGAHFGIDSCRACAAFFRRTLMSKTKQRLECSHPGRNGKHIRECKKCRMDMCLMSGMLPSLVTRDKDKESDTCLSYIPSIIISNPNIILLHRMLGNYKEFSKNRLAYENSLMYSRDDSVLYPIEINEPYDIYKGSHDLANMILQGEMTFYSKYLELCFEEFHILSADEKWILWQNFFFLINFGEGYYRALAIFKDRPLQRYMVTYITVLDTNDIESFYEGSSFVSHKPNNVVDVVNEVMRQCSEHLIPIMERLNLQELEFIAVITIALWSFSTSAVPRTIDKIGQHYRKKVFDELHVLYRDDFKLDNYATRLGDLMNLVSALEQSSHTTMEELQFLDFFNVFDKDSFTSCIVSPVKIKDEEEF